MPNGALASGALSGDARKWWARYRTRSRPAALPTLQTCVVNKPRAARRDGYGGTRDGRRDAWSRGRAGTSWPPPDRRLIPSRATNSPAARPESPPTPQLQTAVRQFRKLAWRLLPVVYFDHSTLCQRRKAVWSVLPIVGHYQRMSRNMRGASGGSRDCVSIAL